MEISPKTSPGPHRVSTCPSAACASANPWTTTNSARSHDPSFRITSPLLKSTWERSPTISSMFSGPSEKARSEGNSLSEPRWFREVGEPVEFSDVGDTRCRNPRVGEPELVSVSWLPHESLASSIGSASEHLPSPARLSTNCIANVGLLGRDASAEARGGGVLARGGEMDAPPRPEEVCWSRLREVRAHCFRMMSRAASALPQSKNSRRVVS
mmetsp:Transcript_57888/g.137766  ORF Transcript_57888/g.137766 Transcript_57888/m.137766 type:complete len:212 (+) Transcript_57888:392-1027(+)